MASAQTLGRIESLAWVAIYAGCFAVVLGIVTHEVHGVAGWSLGVLGSIAVAAGVVLIVVRSRLAETPVTGPQSGPGSQGQV